MRSFVFIVQGIASFLFFVGVVGIISHLFNVLIFGEKDRRTKDEMWGMPIAMGAFIIFFLIIALLINAILH